MANEKKQIKSLLVPLHKQQQILFGIICVKRVINLYKIFDNEYDINIQDSSISKGEGYNKLTTVLEFIENKIESTSEEEINNIIKQNINLVPNPELFDLNAEVYIAQLIAQSALNILRFSITDDIDKILFCTGANLEIVNQIKDDQYYNNVEINTSITEDEFLNSAFEEELKLEIETIEMIKENKTKSYIDSFILEHLIKWEKYNV